MENIDFLPCGDTALSIQLGFDIDRETSLKILALKAVIEQSSIPGIIETVPSFRSLLVHYDPLKIRQKLLIERLKSSVGLINDVQITPRRWRVPVCFDAEFALDITEVSEIVDTPIDKLIEDFSATEFFVYMVGFFLGFVYLGDLPNYMKCLSRKQDPRVRLEAGSVVTAQGLAVLHSIASPGGWNVMGRSPVSLFDINNMPPALFAAGDQINFFAIDKQEFEDIKRRTAANEHKLEHEVITP